jgi:hypothetical protein
MTLDSGFASALEALLAAFAAVFGSGFLFVTGAFGFSGAAVFAEALDEDDAFDTGAAGAFFDTVVTAAVAVFATALLGAFALLAGLAAAEVFTAGFAIDLPEAGLVAADWAFFAATVVFAGFFIAFAMGS